MQRAVIKGSVYKTTLFFTSEGEAERVVESAIYDRRGNCVNRTVYEKEGRVNNVTKSIYNQENNKISESIIDSNNNIISKTIWKYNSDGMILKRSRLDGKGETILLQTWIYNSSGRVFKEERVSPLRLQENQSIIFQYNEAGKLKLKTKFDYKNVPFRKRLFAYRKTGELLREAIFKLEISSQKLMETILENKTYDEFGRLIETITFHPEGHFHRKWTYRYDSKGNKTEEALYLQRGRPESRWVYHYDSDKNLIDFNYEKKGIIRKRVSPQSISKGIWKHEELKDPSGNWIRKTVYMRKTDGISFKRVGVYNRKIEYFSK